MTRSQSALGSLTRSTQSGYNSTYTNQLDVAEFESRLRESLHPSRPPTDSLSRWNESLSRSSVTWRHCRRVVDGIRRLSLNGSRLKPLRQRLKQKWRTTGHEQDHVLHHQACRHATKLLNSFHQQYFQEQLLSADSLTA